jgi:hypothetical protein
MCRPSKAISISTLIAVASFAAACKSTPKTVNIINENMTAITPSPTPANSDLTREEFDNNQEQYEQEAKALGYKIGSGSDDLWLWAKARSSLATADGLTDSIIKVDVERGVITLSGKVADNTRRTKAEQVVKGIEGVKSVKNRIKVAKKDGKLTANQRPLLQKEKAT